jgi:hypothetical protein
MSIADHVHILAEADESARHRAGALLIVRYFAWHDDARLSPWFEEHRQVMAALSNAALAAAHGQSVNPLLQAKIDVDRLLDEADPDWPDYGTAVGDHLNFASEVLDFVGDPGDMNAVERSFEHANDLASSAEEMGEEDYQGEWERVEFLQLEERARLLSIDGGRIQEAIDLSLRFAESYAELIAHSYTDEDAGRA